MGEIVADWCETQGDVTICGTNLVGHSRQSMGVKWCFCCRKRHEFWWVVMTPVGMSYYGPHAEVRGIGKGCSDLFPGWTREWTDD